MAKKRGRASGEPRSLGEDVAEDAAHRAASRERIAKSVKQKRKKLETTSDPRVADRPSERWRSRRVARGEREAAVEAERREEELKGLAPENEWPKQYRSAAGEEARLVEKARRQRVAEARKELLEKRGWHGFRNE